MTQLIDGKLVAKKYKTEIRQKVELYKQKYNKVPHLAIVRVGEDSASATYVANKIKACEEVGFQSSLFTFPSTISQEELLDILKSLNENSTIDGYIVQSPLPSTIDFTTIVLAISPEKDVDGFHPLHVGKMAKGLPSFISATPKGIIELFKFYNIQTQGKNCVIVGRSQIVGLPMALLLQQNSEFGNATVTIVHSHTKNSQKICSEADILIVAIGKPGFITQEFVKTGAVVIDVGINHILNPTKKNGYSLMGDVDFEGIYEKCSFITPVPGGVGPMTVVSLLQNTLLAFENTNLI